MKHELWVLRHEGIRHWIAWCLVRLAYRVKDTEFHQVVRISAGSAVLITGDAWGGGIAGSLRVNDWDSPERTEAHLEWPMQRDFDVLEDALDWMYEGDEAVSRAELAAQQTEEQ